MISQESLDPSAISEILSDTHMHGSLEASQVRELAKIHPDFLGGLAMPDIHEVAFPPMYLAIWQILTQYSIQLFGLFKYFALGLPRGFAKTTFGKLLILWVILFTKRRFILIVAETAGKANNIIADIFDMLDEPNVRAAFGDWRMSVEIDRQDLKKFGFRGRTIIVAGLGVNGSVRGLNIKNVRPDFMFLDDIQSREAADSDIESQKIERWLQGTLLKAKSNKGVLVIFLANMYPTENSLLRKLKYNPEWEKLITGGLVIGDDGAVNSLWEGVRSLESLMQEYNLDKASGQEEVFFAEVLNDETASVNRNLDVSRIPRLPFDDPETEIHQGSFIVIDPATGKKRGDAVAIGYFQVHDARGILWDLEAERFNPLECVKLTLRWCIEKNCRLVFVESVAYQSTLAFWFREMLERLGIQGISIVEIYPGRSSKNSRILTMFKQLTGRPDSDTPGIPEIFLHDRVRDRVLHQARAFDALRTDNVDDILDLLCYVTPILTKHQAIIQMSTPLAMQEFSGEEVSSLSYSEQHNSPF